MADDKMTSQYPERDQRYAVCNSYADKSAEYALDPEKGDRPLEDMVGSIEAASKIGTVVLDFETV